MKKTRTGEWEQRGGGHFAEEGDSIRIKILRTEERRLLGESSKRG